MRVRIQRGASSIEVEGEASEVEATLRAWWAPGGDGTADGGEALTTVESNGSKRTRTKRAKPERRSVENGFDFQGTVNSIRNDPRFDLIKAKLIVGDASRGQRAKFVSWFVKDRPLTSGDIQRVLQGLGVKIDPSMASRAMTDAKDAYIKDTSVTPTTFRLTARGHEEFENWLLNG